MAINFNNSKSISEVDNKLYIPGQVVQTVHTTYASLMNTSSTSPVDFFTSNPITMTSASNKLVIELHSDNRVNDWGDGVWNLFYMDIIHVNTGTQLFYSGYIGEQTYSIRHFHRSVSHSPGSVGPHTYKCRGWSYQASQTTFNGGGSWVDNDGIAYLRITEIAA
jgi:hypothetical protein